MAKSRELWDNKVTAPTFRRSAHQMDPRIARMYTDSGLAKVGGAIMEIGQKLHQVNVTRQVAKAMANYKMKEADFLMKMQSADPSTTDFTQAYNEFYNSQGSLATGVSRDASQIISNKLAAMGASTYGSIKRMELRNTREMALAEVPDVLEGLVREQVTAEMAGDSVKAAQAQQDYEQYIEGLGPALRPGEKMKLAGAYDEALKDARVNGEKQAIAGLIMTSPETALEMIPNLPYSSNSQKLSMMKSAKAGGANKIKVADLQVAARQDAQSGQMLDGIRDGGAVPPITDMDEALQPAVDAVNDTLTAGTVFDPADRHPLYFQMKDTLNKLGNKNPFVSDTDLLEARSVMSQEDVDELRAMNALNEQIYPKRDEVKTHIDHIKANMNTMFKTLNSFDDVDTAELIKAELRIEYDLLINEAKIAVSKNIPRQDITKTLNGMFEGTSEGIMKNFWSRKVRKGEFDFTDKYREGKFKAGTDVRRKRRQGVMSLLQDENWERELEVIAPKWFTGEIVPPEPVELPEVTKTEVKAKIKDIESGRITDDEFIEWVENERLTR